MRPVLGLLCCLVGPTISAQSSGDAAEPAVAEVERALFAKGQTLYNEGLYGESIAVLSDFLTKHPQSTISDLVLLWLGRSHLGQGNIAAAEKVAAALRAIPDTALLELYEGELTVARQNYGGTDSSSHSGKSDLHSAPVVAATGAGPAKTPELNRTSPSASVTALSPQLLKESKTGTSLSEVVPHPVKLPAVAVSTSMIPVPAATPPVLSLPRRGPGGRRSSRKACDLKGGSRDQPVITPAPVLAKEADRTRKLRVLSATTGRFTEVAAVG